MQSFLPDEEWTTLLRGLAAGHYHLLLGAGASAGGLDGMGGPLPLARALTSDLAGEFSLPGKPGDLSLSRAYDAARRRDIGKLNSYLYNRFAGCVAPEWFDAITDIRWRRIWTLNIDDCLDNAFGRQKTKQRLVPTNWDYPFRESGSLDEVDAVHLHGRARLLDQDNSHSLVFGAAEYFEASQQRYAWHHVFKDLFLDLPFLIVGATLTEEQDLAKILQMGNVSKQTTGTPSIVLLRDFDELRREELEAAGLTPIATEAAPFFEAVAKALPEFEGTLPSPVNASGSGTPDRRALEFLTQFRPLQAQERDERDKRHDLYSGHEPTWQDIVRRRDAVFNTSTVASSRVQQAFAFAERPRIICIHGPRFTGKTTSALRAAYESLSTGAQAFLFVGDERLDIDSAKWWIEKSQRVVLVFDGLADHAPDLADLFEILGDQTNKLVILATERSGRMNRLENRLPVDQLDAARDLELARLENDNIRSLVAKLHDAGRLGRISRLRRTEQEAYFRNESGRQLFAGMARLERAAGFTTRLRGQYELLNSAHERRAYATCCLVYAVGYSTPLPIVARVSGLDTNYLVNASSHSETFSELTVVDGDKIRTRQRTLASLVAEEVLSAGDRFELTSSIAQALAPYVTRETIRQRSLASRIAGELMDETVIRDWVGADKAEQWYEAQASAYSWNARFWEQRALAASSNYEWNLAESYAERAVSTHRDPFTANTLGTILMRKALHDCPPSSSARLDYYQRAVDALNESRSFKTTRYEYPYITFFQYSLRLMKSEMEAGTSSLSASVYRVWDDWMKDARWSDAFTAGSPRQKLESLQADWLMLATR